MTLTDVPSQARDGARYMNGYARRFSAGAFATPTAAEITKLLATGHWKYWPGGAAATRTLTRDSRRKDFTGREFVLHAGHKVITHLAVEPGSTLPDLSAYDWIFAYVEDTGVTQQLRTQGREIRAVRISAASEIIACWGRDGQGFTYPRIDAATVTQLPLDVPEDLRSRVLAELSTVDSWHDDFPFYSDGSWDAVSLRGFNPADPSWGVKPSEMSKSWWAEHPDAHQYSTCDWTILAARLPATVELVTGVAWWRGLERVRLLRMQGRDGKGGSLGRHTDVTDRAAGTLDGQIMRFHIPLITHPDITMSAWNLAGRHIETHLPPWTMWYLDARKPHAVDNRAGIDRIHLVVDVVASAQCREIVEQGREAGA